MPTCVRGGSARSAVNLDRRNRVIRVLRLYIKFGWCGVVRFWDVCFKNGCTEQKPRQSGGGLSAMLLEMAVILSGIIVHIQKVASSRK